MYKRKWRNVSSAEYTAALEDFNELQDKLYKENIDKVQYNICSNPTEVRSFASAKQKKFTYPQEMQYKNRKSKKPNAEYTPRAKRNYPCKRVGKFRLTKKKAIYIPFPILSLRCGGIQFNESRVTPK